MNVKKAVAVGLSAVAMLAGAAGSAMADTAYVGGGTWDYGTGGGSVWSNYYHGNNCHSSSVDGSRYVDSGPTNPGIWSRASAPDTIWGDRSWWNNGRGGC